MTDRIAAAPANGEGAEFQLLRSRIESELRAPAIVVVASAMGSDGTNLTSYSLANCLTKAGHRAVLVQLQPAAAGDMAPPSGDVTLRHYDGATGIIARDEVSAFVSEIRQGFDYAVIDAGVMLNSDLALAVGRHADGMLVSVRIGRAPIDEDEKLVRIVAQMSGNIVGVVATTPEMIAEFEDQRARGKRFSPNHRREPVNAPAWAQPLRRAMTTAAAVALMFAGSTMVLSSVPDATDRPTLNAVANVFGTPRVREAKNGVLHELADVRSALGTVWYHATNVDFKLRRAPVDVSAPASRDSWLDSSPGRS